MRQNTRPEYIHEYIRKVGNRKITQNVPLIRKRLVSRIPFSQVRITDTLHPEDLTIRVPVLGGINEASTYLEAENEGIERVNVSTTGIFGDLINRKLRVLLKETGFREVERITKEVTGAELSIRNNESFSLTEAEDIITDVMELCHLEHHKPLPIRIEHSGMGLYISSRIIRESSLRGKPLAAQYDPKTRELEYTLVNL